MKRSGITSFLFLSLSLAGVFFVYATEGEDDSSVVWRWRFGNPNIYFNYDMPWRGVEIIVDDISLFFNADHQLEFWLRWSPKLENFDLTVRFTDEDGGVSKIVSVRDFLTQEKVLYACYRYYIRVKISMAEFIGEGFQPTAVREIILEIPRQVGEGRAWVDDILIRGL